MIAAPAPLIPDILRLNGRWRRRSRAVTCGDVTLTWGEFDARTEQVANALVALGLRPGEAVGILMNNGLEMVEEKARSELGMLKADEILVQVTPVRR